VGRQELRQIWVKTSDIIHHGADVSRRLEMGCG
jgi:hypothetical protein